MTGPPHTESEYPRFIDDDGSLRIVDALPTGQVKLVTGLAVRRRGPGRDQGREVHDPATAKQVSRLLRRFRPSGATN